MRHWLAVLFSASTWQHGLQLAALSGVLFALTWWINADVLAVTLSYPGIAPLFLPAGIKLGAMLVARGWGALGVGLGFLVLAPGVWPEASAMAIFVLVAAWTIGSLVLVLVLLHHLGIHSDLSNLSFLRLMAIITIASLGHGMIYNATLVVLGLRPAAEWWETSLNMAMGDFFGCAVLAIGFLLLERLLRHRWRR